jgi:hypothetical protein
MDVWRRRPFEQEPWKRDRYDVKGEWITADDPVTFAIYAKDHGLLDTDGCVSAVSRKETSSLRHKKKAAISNKQCQGDSFIIDSRNTIYVFQNSTPATQL